MSLRFPQRQPFGFTSGEHPRQPFRLLGLALLALAATGCLQSTATVVVADDGSGTADLEVAVDPRSVLAQLDAGPLPLPAGVVPTDAAGVCASVSQAVDLSVPPGASHEPFDEGGRCGERVHLAFTDPAQLTIAFNAFSGAEEAEILRRSDHRWLFDAPVVEPIDLAPRPAALPPAVIDQIQSQRTLTYVVTLPGSAVGDTTADRVQGGTFTWEIAPDDARRRLVAVTATDGGGAGSGPPLVPLVGGAAGLVALAGLGLAWRARRRPAPVVAPMTASDPTPGAASAAATQSAWPPAPPEPRWDPSRDAWVADHPVEGLVVYDDATGQWHRA
ncbi:MAG: hypothetical protein OEY41_02730 [Acidimicrobiia bacterium]|nr:hypothetical protein [Acidimicrobiia bacterium]MDH5288893.1 hypothetical protein [Acidimicrobiia bacterium]